ncbi:MAG: glycosyltransferase [Myxococcales bacterium]|nr:glycosyltransferase [Myxococcales bacterium]
MTFLFKEVNYAIEQNIGRPRTILEIGNDVGQSSQRARSRGARTVGLEMVKDSLPRAKDLLDEAYFIDIASDQAFGPVAGRKFDLVVLEGTLDRVSRPERVLASAVALLEDGGHVLIATANRGGSGPEAGSLSRTVHLLEASGLEVLRIDVNPYIARALAMRLGWYGDPQHEADLKATHTMPGRFTYGHLIRPIERLIAKTAPEALAAEHVILARVPPTPGPLSLTVGMLTLNEKQSVERMIDDVRKYAPDAKILLVDSSSDETPELARAKGARVVRQLPPRGHGPAMERLMYEAANESEALIYLDCDFTYPAHIIPRIRQLLESGVDVVNASRTASYPKAMPVPNFVANRVFAATAQIVHGVPTTDVHSGMRGYRMSMVRAFDFNGEGDAIPLDTLILPARSNYKVVEFPIEYHERVGFSKLAKLRGTVWTFIRIAGAIGHGDRVRRGRRYEVQGR